MDINWEKALRKNLIQVQEMDFIPLNVKLNSKLITAAEFLDDYLSYPENKENFDYIVISDFSLLSKSDKIKFSQKVKQFPESNKNSFKSIIVVANESLSFYNGDLIGRISFLKQKTRPFSKKWKISMSSFKNQF